MKNTLTTVTKMKRKLLLITLIALIFALKNYEMSRSVIINAPIDVVWEYASDSSKAKEWSVFFDHISPLPGIEDGKVGSVRRCYRFQDETGPTWDEKIIKVTPLKFRELRTYHLKNFKDTNFHKSEFKVYQRYESISPLKSRLTFSSKMLNPFNLILAIQLLPLASETSRIFQANLQNIKSAIEARYKGVEYHRPHPFEPYNPISDI